MEAAQLLALIRTGRHAGARCPRCDSGRSHRWGSSSGRQRYRCRRCGRTFTDFTGTPIAYLKRTALLPAYAACMTRGFSVRRTAREVGMHPATAFRWRHRFCSVLVERREELAGWLGILVLRFPESRKGDRRLTRPPRRRRHHRLVTANDPVYVVVAADGTGGIAAGVGGRRRLRPRDFDNVLGPCLGNRVPSVLALEGPRGPACAFATRRGGAFLDARCGGPAESLEPFGAARRHARGFSMWL